MYKLKLDGTPKLDVSYRNHTLSYSTNGSLPNPLEATYAALAGCAGVYAMKACKALGVSAEGIDIDVKPVVGAGNPLMPVRIVTTLAFPPRFSAEQRSAITDAVSQCAVKELIRAGASVEFVADAVDLS